MRVQQLRTNVWKWSVQLSLNKDHMSPDPGTGRRSDRRTDRDLVQQDRHRYGLYTLVWNRSRLKAPWERNWSGFAWQIFPLRPIYQAQCPL